MAILYGTTDTAEVLPVQVNSKGQLVAEGLPGPQGPQGGCAQSTIYVSANQPNEELGKNGDFWIQLDYTKIPE